MKVTCAILFISSILVIGTYGGSDDFTEPSLISESPSLSSYLTGLISIIPTEAIPTEAIPTEATATTEIIPSGGGLPNNICSPYVSQYLSLSSPVRTQLYDFISANQRTSFEALATQTKTFISTLNGDSSLSASDHASLNKFMTEELIQGVSTIVCFLAYELDKMPTTP